MTLIVCGCEEETTYFTLQSKQAAEGEADLKRGTSQQVICDRATDPHFQNGFALFTLICPELAARTSLCMRVIFRAFLSTEFQLSQGGLSQSG